MDKLPAKSAKQRSAEYRARQRATGKKHLSVMLSEVTFQRIESKASDSISLSDAVEMMLSQSVVTCHNQDIEALKTELEKEKELHALSVRTNQALRNEITQKHNDYLEYLKKYNVLNKDKLPALRNELKLADKHNAKQAEQIQRLETKLCEKEQTINELKQQLDNSCNRYQELINLSASEFAEFQKSYFVQYGKKAAS